MFLWAVVLWVGGLVTIVPFAAYYLLFHAQRDEYAFLITLVLFWIFGFWGIVAPILTILKVRTVFRRIEQAQTQGNLREALRNKETEEVLVNLIASENRVPRFVAAKVYRLVAAKLSTAQISPPGPSH